MPNPYVGGVSTSNILNNAAGKDKNPQNRNFDAPTTPVSMVLKRLMTYVKPHIGLLVLSFVCAFVSVLAQILVPIYIGRGIDRLIGQGLVDFAGLVPILIQLGVTVAISAVATWASGYANNRLAYEVVCDVRLDAYKKFNEVPLSFMDSHSHGDLLSRIINDCDAIGDGLLQGFNQLFTGIITIVGTLIFMFTLSVPVALVVVVLTPLSILVATLITRGSAKSFAAQQALQGELSGYAEEMITNQKLVYAFGCQKRNIANFEAINEKLYTAGVRAQFVSSLSNPSTRLVNNLIYATVAMVGISCVITGQPLSLTVGQVQSFLSYATQYMTPFNQISAIVTQVQMAFASAHRVFALMDAEPEKPDAPNAVVLDHPKGAIKLDKVTFSYRKDAKLLEGISFEAKPGERLALVGPTGCGKTTLINLLLRFYDPDEGTISLDGHNTQHVTRSSLRGSVGMVLQETWLFEGTIRDNIAYGKPDATLEEVKQAAERAHADGFIEQLPQGYDTLITEDGGSISQGQRQLLCIARVMLTDPAILFLDEATSSIDTRTELQVQDAFDEMMKGRTSLVVAHRLSTVRNADCILVIDHGHIIERGTHGELLKLGGFYAKLYQSQWDALPKKGIRERKVRY